MARILLGWELGAGAGHHVKLRAVAAELKARGHEPVLALQQTDSLDPDLPCWQAPLWPGQIVTRARAVAKLPATMGDILATIGLDDVEALRALIAAWGRLIAAVDPALVMTEFAPGLQMAAYGRVPVLAMGTGFTLPPADVAAFPSLTGLPSAEPEPRLLGIVNRALAANGLPQRSGLPGIFAADASVQSVFTELDPYRDYRTQPPAAPSGSAVDPDSVRGLRDEVFVYLNGTRGPQAPFWQGLVDCGLPVRLYCGGLGAEDSAKLEAASITVEAKPVPFERIAARSRFVVSHGGLGFTISALAAGLPHILAPRDLEKELNARDVAAMGLGGRVDLELRDAAAFAATLRATYEDTALGARARARSASFRERMRVPMAVHIAERAAALIG